MDNIIILNDKITWYTIEEDGNIRGFLKNLPAIYIYKLANERRFCYIGSSFQLVNRTNYHKNCINNWNKDYYNNNGSLFYNSVLEHGWKNFKFGILEDVNLFGINNSLNEKNFLLKREQYYLDTVNPSLNICKIAGSPLGIKHNIIFSKNLSKARRGKRNNASKLVVTKPKYITTETRLKLSYRSKGIKVKLFDNLKNLIKEFDTMTSVAKYLGVSDRTIRRILNTGISYDNYTYEFENIIPKFLIVTNNLTSTVKKYCSVRAIAKDINISTSSISKAINTNKPLKNIYLISRK